MDYSCQELWLEDIECSLESFGSGTDSCTVTLNTGDMLDIELDTRAWGSEVMVTVTEPDGTSTQYGRNQYTYLERQFISQV